jgi:hypothetical protein
LVKGRTHGFAAVARTAQSSPHLDLAKITMFFKLRVDINFPSNPRPPIDVEEQYMKTYRQVTDFSDVEFYTEDDKTGTLVRRPGIP